MGKKDKTSVGRAMLKHKSKGANLGKGKESWLHTSELNDGEDWSKLNTKSVTEQSALDEFLATAELAGTEFVAEKLNISIFNADHSGGLPSRKDEQRIQEIQEQHRQFLQIPRRPKWDEQTTPEQLDQLEKDYFLSWRRGLAELQEKDDLIMTPFERNLEFWRQLWRVIERSDVVVQIVDARNPLLFRCEDLESYVTEVSQQKVNVLLVNKADYLTQKQRESWATFFKSISVKAVFWSAVFETERLKQLKLIEEMENTPVQPRVVTEEPEAVLTDNHVTQFLNLEELDNVETDTTKDFGGLNDPGGNDPRENNPSGNDHKDNVKCDLTEIELGQCDSLEDYLEGSGPLRSSAMKSDSMNSGPCTHAESDSNQSRTIENTQKVVKASEPNCHREDNVKEVDIVKKKIFTSEDTYDDQNNHMSNSPTNIPKLSQLNLLPNEGNDSKEGSTSGGMPSNDVSTGVRPVVDTGSTPTSGERVAGKNVEFYTSGHLLTGEELLAYCQWLHHRHGGRVETERELDGEQQTVIGLVGYPNVGKSSTINAVLQAKKVPVSSTPGRTKHFQTLLVDKTICLCDCPGLVFPSFVSTKAEMVICGILPIDQLRDHVPPVSLVCRRIPRNVLEAVYGIMLSKPEEWEDPNRPPYAEELLDAYGYNRGYITSQGRPDNPRSARYILKDYVNGKLLYCHPPPSIDSNAFQMSFTADEKSVKKKAPTSSKTEIETQVNKMDSDFFRQINNTVSPAVIKQNVKSYTSATTGTEQYQRNLMASRDSSDPNMVIVGKPWKKHGNRNKKEKLRRLKPTGY